MISIVIPAFNAAKFIKRTIESILAQSYTDCEIIVVDDGSSDNTAEVIKSYGEKIRYIYQQNAGDGPARNTGIAAARGEWIAFIDHDDEWLPKKLEHQMELLSKNPELKWCASNFYRQIGNVRSSACDQRKLLKTLSNRFYFENIIIAMFKKQAVFMTSTMIIHKDVFEKTGVFDSCWLRCADIDMWWRIGYVIPQVGYVPQPLAILHLDVQDSIGTNLRLQTKRGEDDRKLIARHLQLAAEHNCINIFRPYAKQYLRNSLIIAIYHGFKTDARMMASEFRGLLGLHWLAATYLLTIFPKVISGTSKGILAVIHKLGFERELSRRWLNSKRNEKS